jgi:hypothetical protein
MRRLQPPMSLPADPAELGATAATGEPTTRPEMSRLQGGDDAVWFKNAFGWRRLDVASAGKADQNSHVVMTVGGRCVALLEGKWR